MPNSPSISVLVLRIASQKAIFRVSPLSNSATKPSEIGPIEDKQRERGLLESPGMRADYDEGARKVFARLKKRRSFLPLTFSSQKNHIRADGTVPLVGTSPKSAL